MHSALWIFSVKIGSHNACLSAVFISIYKYMVCPMENNLLFELPNAYSSTIAEPTRKASSHLMDQK